MSDQPFGTIRYHFAWFSPYEGAAWLPCNVLIERSRLWQQLHGASTHLRCVPNYRTGALMLQEFKRIMILCKIAGEIIDAHALMTRHGWQWDCINSWRGMRLDPDTYKKLCKQHGHFLIR